MAHDRVNGKAQRGLVLAEPTVKGSPFTLTRLGISSALAEATMDQCADFGQKLIGVRDGLQWVAGDWLCFLEDRFGEDHAQLLDSAEWEPKTLSNYANVCRAFPYARRRAALPFAYHAEVYKLPERAREHLLDLAEAQGLKRADLRRLASKAKRDPGRQLDDPTGAPAESRRFLVLVAPDRVTAWYDLLDTAKADGMIAAWEEVE